MEVQFLLLGPAMLLLRLLLIPSPNVAIIIINIIANPLKAKHPVINLSA
jgi:hypothetical protein